MPVKHQTHPATDALIAKLLAGLTVAWPHAYPPKAAWHAWKKYRPHLEGYRLRSRQLADGRLAVWLVVRKTRLAA